MKTINATRAKEIAAYWHGGQWSALYQFCSTGIFKLENTLNYFKELQDCMHPEYALHPGVLSKSDERELNQLDRYFTKQCTLYGIEIEYHPHPLYGYLIPYIKTWPKHIDIAILNPVKIPV